MTFCFKHLILVTRARWGQNKLGGAVDFFLTKGGGVHCFRHRRAFFMPH